MKNLSIKKIEYLGENRKDRKLKITLNNGAVINAEKCHESWQQWGGSTEELKITMPTVEKHNEWLHGGKKP